MVVVVIILSFSFDGPLLLLTISLSAEPIMEHST